MKLRRNEKINQAEEFLWQQTQERFNEIKKYTGERHRMRTTQKRQPQMKKEDFVEAIKKNKNATSGGATDNLTSLIIFKILVLF